VSVVLQGGFPEEVHAPRCGRPLGWALSAHLALVKIKKPSEDLPAPRLVEAELVASGRRFFSQRDAGARWIASARSPPRPPKAEEESPPPSLEAAQGFIATLQS